MDPSNHAAPLLLRHRSSLGHDTGAHPERPERMTAIDSAIDERADLRVSARESPPAQREHLLAVHPEPYVSRIEALCRGGGGQIDIDTIATEGSWDAALHGAGGAVALVDALLAGEAPSGFSVHRPPGHHAEPARAMGFCLFNSVAVAARHAVRNHGLERVLVLDWDVHHGNGTNEAFHAESEVLFVSIHESPLYPGSGPESDVGSGNGEGATVNCPVPAGSGDEVFRSFVDDLVVPLARAFEPQLLLVSAGYDAHADDPLASCRVSDEGYGAMTASMRAVAEELGIAFGFTLEGGYDLGALARGVAGSLEVLAATETPSFGSVEPHPLALARRDALARHWPALA